MKCELHQPNGDLSCNDCYGEALFNKMDNAKSQEEARQYAIEWQNWAGETQMYMSELVEWQGVLTDLALNWGLVEEFEENGIGILS